MIVDLLTEKFSFFFNFSLKLGISLRQIIESLHDQVENKSIKKKIIEK